MVAAHVVVNDARVVDAAGVVVLIVAEVILVKECSYAADILPFLSNLYVLVNVFEKLVVISLVRSSLKTGRFHQIRAQFASRKMPLIGDKKYGSRDFLAKYPALFAYRLTFDFNGKPVDIKAYPCLENYPWLLFKEEKYV